MSNKTFKSKRAVCQMTSLSAVTKWRMEGDGKFPKRRKISAARMAWVKEEVQDWIDSRVNAGGKADDNHTHNP